MAHPTLVFGLKMACFCGCCGACFKRKGAAKAGVKGTKSTAMVPTEGGGHKKKKKH